ncbi:Hypothetical predicted protein, partial [Paramuricea clavata]
QNHWNLCTPGYYLSGLYRTGGNNLHNIEAAWCCKPNEAPNSYTSCYDEDVSSRFNWDKEGMVSCTTAGYYITGLYRSECHRLDTTKTIKCVHAESGVDCILQCLLQDESCRSTNFRKTFGEQENCELLKTVDSEEPAENLQDDENFDYYILLQPERKPEDAVSSSNPPQLDKMSTTNSTMEKTDDFTTQPTTKSTLEKADDSTTQPTTKYTLEKTEDSTTQPTTKSTTEKTDDSTIQPTTKSTPKQTDVSTTPATPKSTPKKTGNSTTPPTRQSTPKRTDDSTTQPTTHDIPKEQRQMLVLKARRDSLDNVREKDFYSIRANESSDINAGWHHNRSDVGFDGLDLCQALYAIVGTYPKRILQFEEIQEDFKNENDSDEYKVLRLQSLSATRWTKRVKAADVIFDNTIELRTILEKLKENPYISADTKTRIRGILKKQMSSLYALFN